MVEVPKAAGKWRRLVAGCLMVAAAFAGPPSLAENADGGVGTNAPRCVAGNGRGSAGSAYSYCPAHYLPRESRYTPWCAKFEAQCYSRPIASIEGNGR
jgi:hypothetical protein